MKFINIFKIKYSNPMEMISIIKDIFVFQEYKFTSKKKKPFIIDCGSHIGLSIIYFKKLYPSASIIGFEANPKTYALLVENISRDSLTNVELVNKAVGKSYGKIDYYVSALTKNAWSWGDSGVKNAWYNSRDYKTIQVPCVKLSKYINKEVDLIKIDIEGMEEIVLQEIKPKLKYVNEIIMEYHGSKKSKNNQLKNILNTLEENGFDYRLKYPSSLLHPFRKEISNIGDIKTDVYFLIIHARKID